MASFADSFIQEAFRANAASKDQNAGSGFKLGAEIAQHAEQVKMQQAQVAQKMQELEQAKLSKLVDFVKDARNYQNAGDRNRYLKGAIGLRNTLGIRPEVMPDEQITSFGSDENMGRISSLEAAIGRGELTMTEATAIAADPQRFGAVVPIPADAIKGSPDLNEAQKQFLDRQSSERAAQARAGQNRERQAGTQDRFNVSNLKDLVKTFDSKIGKQKDRLQAAQSIEELLNSKQPLSDNATRTQLARLSGEVGPLSDFDVKSWSGDRSLLEQAKQYMATASTGKVTEENRSQMRKVAATMKTVIKNRIKAESERTLRLGEASQIDRETLRSAMAVDEIIGKQIKMSNGKEYDEADLRKLLQANPKSKFADEIREKLGAL